jgi:hypothetical protein
VRGLPLVLLAVLLTACGGSASAPEATGSDGFTRYELSSGRFSIEVPEVWHGTTGTQMQRASFKTFARENPVFRPYAEAAARKNSSFKFFAYDPVVRKRFATNLNILVTRADKRTTAGRYRSQAIREARSVAAGKVHASDVVLPAGPAVRLEYRARFSLAGAGKAVSILQYGLLLGGKTYILTYTTLPAFAAEYEYSFKRSANSFRLTSR